MTYRLQVSRRAARQIRVASSWWLDHREKAPLAFAEDLNDALHLIVDVPRAGEEVQHSRLETVRRLLMPRTHYHLYYSVDDTSEVVQVLALWHTSRGIKPTL